MAFKVDVEIDETFETECPAEKVFEVLADVPHSVSHFPKVDNLEDEGDGVYRWEMEKIGVQSYYLQTVYACKYVSDPKKLTVKWTPVKGVGNAVVSGKWTLKDQGKDGTVINLTSTATLEIPFPKMVKMLLGGVVRSEFESMIDTYLDNLDDTFTKLNKSPKKKAAKKKPAAKKKAASKKKS